MKHLLLWGFDHFRTILATILQKYGERCKENIMGELIENDIIVNNKPTL